MFQYIVISHKSKKMILSPVACKNVPDTMTLPVQLTDVAKAIARPLLEAGKISLRRIQTTGPKLFKNKVTANLTNNSTKKLSTYYWELDCIIPMIRQGHFQPWVRIPSLKIVFFVKNTRDQIGLKFVKDG